MAVIRSQGAELKPPRVPRGHPGHQDWNRNNLGGKKKQDGGMGGGVTVGAGAVSVKKQNQSDILLLREPER